MNYSTNQSFPCPQVREMPPVTATALKNHTADILDRVATQGPLAITRHDKPRAVLIPVELYDRLTGGQPSWLAELHAEYRGMLEDMQSPEQKEGATRAFNATPEELGKAAAAQRK
jgi:prevent-host-death family protein